MSVIERALQKMSEKGQQAASPRREVAAPEPAARVTPQIAQPLGDPNGRRVHVNRTSLQSEGLIPPDQQARHLVQQFRQIKRPLIANALARVGVTESGNSATQIMVASSLPGEGKSFTAFNLALSMAQEKDLQVVLVDADVLKPQITRVLGIEDAPGLLDALRDNRMNPASIVLHTDIPNLAVVPAGARTENTTELLASGRMDEIAQALGSVRDRRVVIFDTSPLLLTTESQALAHVAGQVVLVVRAESTPQQTVMDALTHLPSRAGVSLVLNQCISEREPASYYAQGSDPDRTPASDGA